VRPPFARWYRSNLWIVSGNGPVDILLKQIVYRVGFELFILAVSCGLGAIGWWIVAVYLYAKAAKEGETRQN
jgi:hypothetical protein